MYTHMYIRKYAYKYGRGHKKIYIRTVITLRSNTLLITAKYGLITDKTIKLQVSVFPNYEDQLRIGAQAI